MYTVGLPTRVPPIRMGSWEPITEGCRYTRYGMSQSKGVAPRGREGRVVDMNDTHSGTRTHFWYPVPPPIT